MSEYRELIKSFKKSREYVRDFYIYGFKSRDDFDKKSGRTYDNERRRIENWFSDYVKSYYNKKIKNIYLSLNSNELSTNPLYLVWKTKSFTDNDIMLHFFIIDILSSPSSHTTEELTDIILARYKIIFETQVVRKKANEYVAEGILTATKNGRKLYYSLCDALIAPSAELMNAICFYQLDSPLGVIGSHIMHNYHVDNELFLLKHAYFAHTLEDEILFQIFDALNEHRYIHITQRSSKTDKLSHMECLPLKIFISTRSGRRFLCVYTASNRRFFNIRLDHIKSVNARDICEDYPSYVRALEDNIPRCYGVSFGDSHRDDYICLTLRIDDNHEQYILNRLRREGHGGTITKVDTNTYTYEINVFDGNEMMPFIKTFIGRIISFDSSNEYLKNKFYTDMHRMVALYKEE